MKNPVAEFLRKLEDDGLLDPGDSILLAVSGGLDSVAMAHFFHASGRPFAIAHCNFQLRGDESDGDAEFAGRLAARLGIPCFEKKFDTKTAAAERKISIQMAARELRYEWFEEVRAANGHRYIATAHHLDDSRETALLQFFRGTGLRGLRGMLPLRGNIVRPLLGWTKQEIRQAAERDFPGFEWREDSSNSKADYDRNFLRHELLPVVEKGWPGFFSQTLDANMERARQAELLLGSLTGFLFEKYAQTVENQTVVDVSAIRELPAPCLLLGEMLRPFGFRESPIPTILVATEGERGRQFFSKNHRLTVDGSRLFIEPSGREEAYFFIEKGAGELALPGRIFRWGLASELPASAPNGPVDRVFFDKKRLVFPLTLRHWRPGDRFRPAGMGGHSKKLQDFFKDLKLARPEKDRVWLLENGDGEILWVVGLRRSEGGAGEGGFFFETEKNATNC